MLMRVSEAAKTLGVSIEHARRKIRSGEWPVYQLGTKATRLDPEEIKALGKTVAAANRTKRGCR
jgi:excisionase family DNA binding protein